MSDRFEDETPQKWFGLTRMRAGILAALAAVAISYWVSPAPKPFANPQIKSEAFVWPAGCEKKEYKEWDEINDACLIQYIGDGAQWGWPTGGRTRWPEYYRIGNDAMRISRGRSRNITHIIKNVYIVGSANG
jgi:hypothetical protein